MFFQTHTPYPSFRETFLGALNASAHVLLVTCSPHVAREQQTFTRIDSASADKES